MDVTDDGILTITGTGDMASRAFQFNQNVKSVVIGDGVTSIGEYAFHNCSGLKEITIPANVTSIGKGAFSDTPVLRDVTILANLTSISESTFSSCEYLTNITLPDTLTSIGVRAFDFCWNLPSITIPANVTSIGRGAFDDCKKLSSICFFGNNIDTIGNNVFSSCRSLSKVYCYTTNTAVRNYEYRDSTPTFIDLDGTSDNITWRLTPDGILTITGTGDIPDPAPWQPLEEAGLIKYTLGGDSTTMVLTEDLTITETLQITGDTTIDLNGHTLTYAGKAPGSVIHVNTGATLTLNDSSENKTGTITGGTGLEVVYTEFEVTDYLGGGVYNEGTFIMNGGTIKDCELPFDEDSHVLSNGGGVYNEGTFTMNGGSIDACSAALGGGVCNWGTFTMNGGVIQTCGAGEGFGVYNRYSVFTMSGTAHIRDCSRKYGELSYAGTVQLYCTTMYADGGEINGDVYLEGIDGFPAIITRSDNATGYTNFDGTITLFIYTSIEEKVCPYTVTFITNGGTSVGPQHILKGQKAQKPADPTKENFTFGKWYNGNTAWNFDTVLTESITLTATWDCNEHDWSDWVKDEGTNTHTRTCQIEDCGKTETEPHTYTNGVCICGDIQYNTTVTFDANGGSVTPKAMTTDPDGTLTSLPTPTRRDYNFQGWFTKDGAQVTTETVFEADTTVYAKWSIKASALLPTWQEWELIDKIVEANKKKDEVEEPTETEPTEVEEPVDEPTKTEPEAPVAPWNNPFADVSETDAFYEAVKFAYENGYMNGTSDNTFAPNEGLTRGMLVTVLYRAAGAPVMDEANPFTDVAADAWYYHAVVWAKSIGLVNGMTETEFAPDAALTREQLVTIFYRYATFLGYDVSEGEDTNILSYEDFADIAEYAIPAMQWACGTGLLDSIDSSLLPQDSATRALVAMVLLGFYGA